ncbi:MAG TPA: SpoIIE family protein phosphatase [Bryobacteraceae bacterium]|nr:SpoIIE family protein phosphatase [Bryobacteraceae bacterium]
MTPAVQRTPKDLVIRDLDGKTVTYPLTKDRIVLGRSGAVELCYPDDIGLSRQHLAIFKIGDVWQVEDLGSKNGTVVNGRRIERPVSFAPGDRISAGHLTIEFPETGREARQTVEFVENSETADTSTTVVANLDGVLGPATDDLNKTYVMQGSPQMRALIRAGRELAGHRSLDELFTLIVDLSLEAVMAGRGVLMTLEGDQLLVRAARGDVFKISATVRDRVLSKKESLLVRDAQLDNTLRQHVSIVEQKVRSLIAVPLQTNDRVIGLIYVDTPHLIREFTREDLNLLTVMANIAAIRIEHARLNEIEEAERLMAKDMQQATIIQRQLLPSVPPPAPGLDMAGRTASCRTVGGDYYDYLRFPDGKVGVLVGDVAGKGMPAALLMSSLQARVHVVFEDSSSIAQKMSRLNKAIASNCPDNRFITFFLGVIDPQTGQVVYSNAGHNPPLVVRAKGGFETLTGGGIILGILPAATYEEFTAQLDPGDILVLFSDGVTEAANPQDQEFGEERLADLVAGMRDRPAREIVEKINDAVMAFTEGAPPADDITVLVVRRTA